MTQSDNTNIRRFEKAITLLEFDRILKAASACALSAESAKIIREELPLSDPKEIRTRKRLVSSFCHLIKNAQGEKRQELPEIQFLFSRLAVEGSVLDADECLALGLFIERGGELVKFILNGQSSIATDAYGVTAGTANAETGNGETLASLAKAAPDCASCAAEIFRVIDKDGNVRDLPEIVKIRRRIKELSKELEQIGNRYNADETTRRMLQSALPSQRDGRLVLQVKANFRGRIKGIVHEISSTGQTVFVEPEESVEKNNQILVERSNLEAEIRRILRALTGVLAKSLGDMEAFHRSIVYLESLRARARYSLEMAGSRFKEPCFASEPEHSGIIMVKQAYHPLLEKGPLEKGPVEKRTVPIDFCVTPHTRMVVITGPNTGGKTVTLKTIGLFALMNQAGFALPAREASMPLFDGVYADIGDEQSLSQSLSTFSAHMTNIALIIAEATEHSLVLLDELGAGTDPEEGSAIAMAILDHFIETKSVVLLTTHHGMLKNYGYSREGVENASVEFDRQTLSPTYRIIMGIPGESRAVDIAARNGFPPALVEKARSYLDKERSDVSALIAGLKEKHIELDRASRSAREEEKRIREERRQQDLKELSLRQKERLLKQEGAAEYKNFLAESRRNLENLVREIREGEITREKTRKVKDFIRTLEEQSASLDAALEDGFDGAGKTAEVKAQKEAEPVFTVGMEVLAGASRRRGTIVRADNKKGAKKRRWIVEIGSVRLGFSEEDLSPALEPKSKHSPGWDAELSTPNAAHGADIGANAKLEINLIGMRMEEALEALRSQIDAAVIAGLREFSVVHGKGDGILQKGVHDYLRDDPAVADYYFSRPEFGGSGRTEVTLRQ